MDDIFCLFRGHIENIAPLKQQYGLTKTVDEVSIIIEVYRTLRDRGPYPAVHVVRDIKGKFAFILYDSSSKSIFIAAIRNIVWFSLMMKRLLGRVVGNLLLHFLKGVSLHPPVA